MNKGIQQWYWKHCKKCDRWLIGNSINFQKDNSKKDHLKSNCKQCCAIQEKNKERNLQRKHIGPKMTKEEREESAKKASQKYRENNKDKIKEAGRRYRENNKDKIKEKNKKYRENNPDIIFNHAHKRRKLIENQGNGINKNQWIEMMTYFNWTCAYSGENLIDIYRTIDHIIPLTKNGVHEIWNLVPMYRSYNSSKKNISPLEWYKQQDYYSEDRLSKIIEWQKYAFNKYANKDDKLILITETI